MHNYPLEKYHFYFHGNRVIAASTYAGRTVRGIAVCAEGDEYDIEKGKKLAAARCNLRIAQKRVARAKKRWEEANAAITTAVNHRDKMNTYYDDSVVAFDEAMRAVESLESDF